MEIWLVGVIDDEEMVVVRKGLWIRTSKELCNISCPNTPITLSKPNFPRGFPQVPAPLIALKVKKY